MATVRLIAAAGSPASDYRAAIVITMPSGSHTYWRSPGEAGVPPVLTETGSSNLATADLLYPAPTRLAEDGIEAIGYKDKVVFPLRVTPSDPGKPTVLRVDLSYAVCDRICVPARGSAALTLPGPSSPETEIAIAEAYQALPAPLPASEQTALDLAPIADAGGKQIWSVIWHGKTPVRDIFVEAPEGFTFETRPAGSADGWRLVVSQAATAQTVPVVLTLAGTTRSFVTTRTLDVHPTKP